VNWAVTPGQERKNNTFWVIVECTKNGAKYNSQNIYEFGNKKAER
jgi:hypothetical protein